MQQEQTEHDDLQTGLDLPNSDGQVSDEDIRAIDSVNDTRPGGQDHSLDNYADSEPTDGVGAVQNRSDTSSDIYGDRE